MRPIIVMLSHTTAHADDPPPPTIRGAGRRRKVDAPSRNRRTPCVLQGCLQASCGTCREQIFPFWYSLDLTCAFAHNINPVCHGSRAVAAAARFTPVPTITVTALSQQFAASALAYATAKLPGRICVGDRGSSTLAFESS
ncbi:hypothetical protein CGGC5_v013617 [Colletotrichum fructicola Nara gc5]|uniref:Uncharacterized protein n=1 Tax=Colletotrichum fructicola (strain Nara gc5) TaxID=1213859 RepID=A0A7J6INR3_COLFN|nr:hypothetical protein CGGC5_v013617 [Colletotrichum fructicola Nara gc5]